MITKDYSLEDDILHIANSIEFVERLVNKVSVSFNERDVEVLEKANARLTKLVDNLSSKLPVSLED